MDNLLLLSADAVEQNQSSAFKQRSTRRSRVATTRFAFTKLRRPTICSLSRVKELKISGDEGEN